LNDVNDIDDDLLRAWLLHRPVDERTAAALEERVLKDDAFGVRLHAIETDLIDDHARGLLDEEDRRAVARWLLATPADRARLRTAVALTATIRSADSARARAPSTRRESRRPRRRAWLALASAAAVVLTVLAFRQYGGYAPPTAGLASNAPTITLLATRQRGTRTDPDATITVARAAPATRLQVEVIDGNDATRYTLSVADATHTVFEMRSLAARTVGPYRFVEATLATGSLREGAFQVRVGIDDPPRMLQEWTVQAHLE
jgi:hypothetical protein